MFDRRARGGQIVLFRGEESGESEGSMTPGIGESFRLKSFPKNFFTPVGVLWGGGRGRCKIPSFWYRITSRTERDGRRLGCLGRLWTETLSVQTVSDTSCGWLVGSS